MFTYFMLLHMILLCEHFITILSMQLFVLLVWLHQNFIITTFPMVSQSFFSWQCSTIFYLCWVSFLVSFLYILIFIFLELFKGFLFWFRIADILSSSIISQVSWNPDVKHSEKCFIFSCSPKAKHPLAVYARMCWVRFTPKFLMDWTL